MTHTQIITELKTLVDANVKEQVVHEFIEQYPWLITGANQLNPHLVISKPPLGADHHPDFAFFRHQSRGEFIELVEIEEPGLNVFTEKDEFTAEFNHLIQQVADWEDWCRRYHDGIAVLMEPLFDMGLLDGLPSFTHVRSRLITGGRHSVLTNARRRKRWQKRVDEVHGREIRTWDGFLESFPGAYYESQEGWKYIKCVRYRNQKYKLIEISEKGDCP